MPVPDFLKGGAFEQILISPLLLELSKVLSSGVVVGCLVFFLSEYVPRRRAADANVGALNSVLATVITALERPGFFNHEYPATFFYPIRDQLAKPVVNAKHNLVTRKISVASLKCGTEVASTRYEDFRGCLVLAAQISPQHALQWLEITDRVRLLADEFEKFPEGRVDITYSYSVKPPRNPLEYSETQMFYENCGVRMSRFLESAHSWQELCGATALSALTLKIRAFLGPVQGRDTPV
jgi:hypothetical protein